MGIRKMPINATSNGTNSHTLLRLLADWRPVEFPSSLPEKDADLELWRAAARLVEQDCVLTIHFADWHIGKIKKEDRYYFTLFEARAASITAIKTCQRMGRKTSLRNFRNDAEKLKAQYDSLGSLFMILFELQEPLIQERASAAL